MLGGALSNGRRWGCARARAKCTDVDPRQHEWTPEDESGADRLVVDPGRQHHGDEGDEYEGVGRPRGAPQSHDDEVEDEDGAGAEHDQVSEGEPGRVAL